MNDERSCECVCRWETLITENQANQQNNTGEQKEGLQEKKTYIHIYIFNELQNLTQKTNKTKKKCEKVKVINLHTKKVNKQSKQAKALFTYASKKKNKTVCGREG